VLIALGGDEIRLLRTSVGGAACKSQPPTSYPFSMEGFMQPHCEVLVRGEQGSVSIFKIQYGDAQGSLSVADRGIGVSSVSKANPELP
jgi:hypothetical protein